MGQTDPVRRQRGYHPTHPRQRQRRHELMVGRITVNHIQSAGLTGPHHFRVEIHRQHPHALLPQLLQDGHAVTAQAKQHHVVGVMDQVGRFQRFLAVGYPPLEDSQHRFQPQVESLGIGDHVHGQGNGHQPHQRHEAQGVVAHMSQTDTHGDKNQRELADLRHRKACQHAGAFAIAHVTHDGHDDKRIANQHKQGKHQRRTQLGPQQGQVQLQPQGDKEKQQQKIPQRRQTRHDGFAIGGRGQCNACQQAAQFLAEAQMVPQRRQQRRPGQGKGHQQFR